MDKKEMVTGGKMEQGRNKEMGGKEGNPSTVFSEGGGCCLF